MEICILSVPHSLPPAGCQDFCPGPTKGSGNRVETDPRPISPTSFPNEKYTSLLGTALILALASAGCCGLSHTDCYMPHFYPQW